jgi:hypothetical protein
MIFQIIFTLFACTAMVSTLHTSRKHHLSVRGMFLWILVWIGALCVVWMPNATNTIAHVLGIGRGVDVVLYSTMTLLCFLLFRLHMKLSLLESHLTKLVRQQALEEENTKKHS